MALQPTLTGMTAPTAALEVANPAIVLPSAPLGDSGGLGQHPALAVLPVELDVAVPIRGFRIRNLVTLAMGKVIETDWVLGDDVPLAAHGAQLAWTEFEVIDSKLAVRISRLA